MEAPVVVAVVGTVVSFPLFLVGFHRLVLAPWLRKTTPGIAPLFVFQNVELKAKEQVTQGAEPIFKLTFALSADGRLQADLGVGEFVRVRHPSSGKMRSYSPLVVKNAGEFELGVRRYEHGHVSKALCDLQVGQGIPMSGPYPPCWVPLVRAGACENMGLVAFGVGITEALPLAEYELEFGAAEQIVLLWATRSEQDVFDRQRIASLEESNGSRFKVVYHYSGSQGRVNVETFRALFSTWDPSRSRFLVVGTRSMKWSAYSMLAEAGFRQKLLRRQPCGCCCRRPRKHT